jgi:hypothetical protein
MSAGLSVHCISGHTCTRNLKCLSRLDNCNVTGSGRAPLTLGADARAIRDFALQQGGIVRGRVLDEFGEPEEGVTIQLYRDDFVASTIPVAGARTDDRGEYRVTGLLPGVYRVSASIRRGTRGEQMMYTGSRQDVQRGAVTLSPGTEVTGIDFNVRLPGRPVVR